MRSGASVGPAASLELILSHDGGNWLARGGGLQLQGRTWSDIDDSLRRCLEDSGRFEGHVRVCMRFDMDGIPRWLHQYSSHYFNRVVTIALPARKNVSVRNTVSDGQHGDHEYG